MPRTVPVSPEFLDDTWALLQRPKPSVQDTMGVQCTSPLYYYYPRTTQQIINDEVENEVFIQSRVRRRRMPSTGRGPW